MQARMRQIPTATSSQLEPDAGEFMAAPRGAWHLTVATALLALGVGCAVPVAVPGAVPGDGRYDGEMCVATAIVPPTTAQSAAKNCSAVELLFYAGLLQVRVSDMSYLLFLGEGWLELTLTHGAIQIDAWRAPYHWSDSTLEFVDLKRSTQYRVRFATWP